MAIGDVPAFFTSAFKLIFDDEFGGTRLNLNKWTPLWFQSPSVYQAAVNNFGYAISPPPVPSSMTSTCDRRNVTVANSICRLALTLGSSTTNVGIAGQTYANAGSLIGSQGRFLTGSQFPYYIEAKIRFPARNSSNQANWTGFWTNGSPPGTWPDNGEIDIHESLNGDPVWHAHQSNGSGGVLDTGGGNYTADGVTISDWATNFHVIGLYRTSTTATFYFDGAISAGSSNNLSLNFTSPHHIILQHMSGQYGDSPTIAALMEIDWVHVYSGAAAAVAVTPESNYTGVNDSTGGVSPPPPRTGFANFGSGGDFVTAGTPSFTDQRDSSNDFYLGTDGSSGIASAIFDGSADWLTRGANLTGLTDGPAGTFYARVKFNGGDGTNQCLLGSDAFIIHRFPSSNLLGIYASTSDFTSGVLDVSSATATLTADGAYHNILISWNTNAAAGLKSIYIYVDDGDRTGQHDASAGDTTPAFNIAYTSGAEWTVGASDVAGSNKLNGSISHLWFTNQFVDIRQTANRRLFYDGTGVPADLGRTGQNPTGTRAKLFLKGDNRTFATNLGTGGAMTTHGTLTAEGFSSAVPSFVGTVNRLDRRTYWAFDGNDQFNIVSSPTRFDAFHKDNAAFTLAAWVYKVTDGATVQFLLTNVNAGAGVKWYLDETGHQAVLVQNAVPGTVLNVVADTAAASNGWHFYALSIDEAIGSGGGFFYVDGNYNQVSASNTFTSTYSSPGSGTASDTERLGVQFLNGARYRCFAAWQFALTKAQLDVIFAGAKVRFGLP